MKYPLALVLILPLAALFLSCTEGANSIFETIINDTQVSNLGQLGNTSNVPSMTKIVSHYYAAVGTVRRRLDTGTTWAAFSLAPGIHYTVATDGANLYGGVIFGDGTGGLYWSADPSAASPSSNPISLTDMKYISKIKNFGASVYASFAKTDGTYSMCGISGGTATEIGGTNAPDPITDFVFAGGNLYFVSGSNVYRGTTATPITPNAAYTYTGVSYDTVNSRLVVSTMDGYIFRSADAVGGDWTDGQSNQCSYTRGTTTVNASFTEIVPLTGSLYLVGSQGAGFWDIDVSGASPVVTRWNGTSYSELYNGAIESIFIDVPAGPRIFFCTAGAGLWQNTYVTDWGTTWTRE